jgi:hypothetical protein
MRTTGRPSWVLCEGKDDAAALSAIARQWECERHLHFEPYGGTPQLSTHLSDLLARPEFARGQIRRLLLTRDADNDPRAAWQEVADAAEDNFALRLVEPGRWHRETLVAGIEVAGWIIPSPVDTGMIETVFLDAARQANPGFFECLDPFLDCLTRRHGVAPHEKARFLIWTLCELRSRRPAPLRAILDHAQIDWAAPAFQTIGRLLQQAAFR